MAGSTGKLTYFISDLHLGAAYFMNPRDHERLVVRWLRSIAPTAGQLYLVGDIIDYWFEYRHVVPRGFTRFLGTLAEMADAGVEITWLIGNHDIWIFDYLPKEIGMRVIDGSTIEEIAGTRFFISHGDGLGRQPLGFRIIRHVFRNRLAQRLFASIHPRWTVGFAYWWSAYNRKRHHLEPVRPAESGTVLVDWASDYNRTHPEADIDWFVFGHFHQILNEPTADGRSRVMILGDWITHMSYAVFDGKSLSIKRFNQH